MSHSVSNILDQGLYLENLDILIPWQASLEDITTFKATQILNKSEQRTDVIWKDVVILGWQKIDITAIFWKNIFSKKVLINFYGPLASEEALNKLKEHLDEYLKVNHRKKVLSEIEYYYEWKIGKCILKIGQGDRFGTFYYIDIKR